MMVGVDVFDHNALLLFLKSPLECPSKHVGIFQTLSSGLREGVCMDTERTKYPLQDFVLVYIMSLKFSKSDPYE